MATAGSSDQTDSEGAESGSSASGAVVLSLAASASASVTNTMPWKTFPIGQSLSGYSYGQVAHNTPQHHTTPVAQPLHPTLDVHSSSTNADIANTNAINDFSWPLEAVDPTQISVTRPQHAAYNDTMDFSGSEWTQISTPPLGMNFTQWPGTINTNDLQNLMHDPSLTNLNQDGGHHAIWPDNRAEFIDFSSAFRSQMSEIAGPSNFQAQSYSDTSWDAVSWQPTPESFDTSGCSFITSQQVSRQESRSSRSPAQQARGALSHITPPEIGTASDQSLLAVPDVTYPRIQQPSDETIPVIRSSPSLELQKAIATPSIVAEGPEQSEQAPPAPTKTKRKRVLTEQGRNRAKLVRQMGSCVRCKMYKIGCDGGNPCATCIKVESTYRKHYSPCYREDILQVKLVRVGSGKSGETRSRFKDYQYIKLDDQPKTLELKWQLPMSNQVELPTWFAAVREFKPRYDDLIHEEWQVNGESRTLKLPAYAASETDILTKSLEDFIEKCRPIMQTLMLEQLTDELSRATFHEAIRHAKEKGSEVIRLALRVRTTALLSAGWGSIIGEETLGTPLVDGANVGYCGDRPTPVPLAHQFDVIFINAMDSIEREVVKLLKKKIYQKEPKPWYEIFLAYFVMLTHLQFIHTQAVGFMRASAGQVNFIIKEMVAKWDYSAGNMLHHYRFVLRGHMPFAVAKKNPEQLRKRDNLDDEALKYINHANSLLSNIDSFKASHDDGTPSLEVDQSWTRQLFREQY